MRNVNRLTVYNGKRIAVNGVGCSIISDYRKRNRTALHFAVRRNAVDIYALRALIARLHFYGGGAGCRIAFKRKIVIIYIPVYSFIGCIRRGDIRFQRDAFIYIGNIAVQRINGYGSELVRFPADLCRFGHCIITAAYRTGHFK